MIKEKRTSVPAAPMAGMTAEDDARHSSERPTTAPEFDMEEFAKRTRSEKPTAMPASPLLLTEPLMESASRLVAAPADAPELELDLPDDLELPLSPRSNIPTPAPETAVRTKEPPGVPEAVGDEVENTISELRAQLEMRNFVGALNLAEGILAFDPEHAEARSVVAACREKLHEDYLTQLGSLAQVPVIKVSPDELRGLALDHRAGFLMSMIDGISSLEMILDMSAMPQLEVLRLMHDLIAQGVVTLS
jgi:hypothetical protein